MTKEDYVQIYGNPRFNLYWIGVVFANIDSNLLKSNFVCYSLRVDSKAWFNLRVYFCQYRVSTKIFELYTWIIADWSQRTSQFRPYVFGPQSLKYKTPQKWHFGPLNQDPSNFGHTEFFAIYISLALGVNRTKIKWN